jgi:hypothetical protein
MHAVCQGRPAAAHQVQGDRKRERAREHVSFFLCRQEAIAPSWLVPPSRCKVKFRVKCAALIHLAGVGRWILWQVWLSTPSAAPLIYRVVDKLE